MIKVDLITGFLGSGKTTFIKKYVRYLLDKGEKIGIIENDYGAINVDMLLLHEEFGDECGMEMVVAADADCHRRRFKTKLIAMGMDAANEGKYDRIIVEPSGIYDVDEFFDILYEEPLDRFYEIGNVIAIVDAGLPGELSKESDYLLTSQIAEAGVVVFSKLGMDAGVKGDGLSKEINDVEKVIVHMNHALDKFKCKRRYATNGDDVVAKDWENLTTDDFERIENSGYVPEDHIKMRVAEDNGYKSLFFYHAKMSEEELKDMAAKLFADSGYGNIYRVKGFVPAGEEVSCDKPSDTCGNYIQINATRENVEITYTDKGQEVIIVIGENLDYERIEECICHYSNDKNITSGQSNHNHGGGSGK